MLNTTIVVSFKQIGLAMNAGVNMYTESREFVSKYPEIIKELETDPIGVMEFFGLLLGKIPTYSSFAITAFGESLFSEKKICDRIDFLYNRHNLEPKPANLEIFNEDLECFLEKVHVGGNLQNVVVVKDISDRCGGLYIVLMKDEEEVYSVKVFNQSYLLCKHGVFCPREKCLSIQDVIDEEICCWRFVRQNGYICKHGNCYGFNDPDDTMSVALLISAASNILDFQGTYEV